MGVTTQKNKAITAIIKEKNVTLLTILKTITHNDNTTKNGVGTETALVYMSSYASTLRTGMQWINRMATRVSSLFQDQPSSSEV